MKELEKIVDVKVKPLLDKAMQKSLGLTISEIETDISDKLKDPMSEYHVDLTLKFKDAKKKFKKEYVAKLLRICMGNVERAAKMAGVDRRTIHRLIKDAKIDVAVLRESADYVKQLAVKDIIEHSLEQYKSSLNQQKYEALYKQAPQLSKEIVAQLPEEVEPLKIAEQKFERAYLKKAIELNKNNISKTARAIGLRFETLHRKLKKLEIKNN